MPARVAELVDAEDLKSFGRKVVRVRLSSWAWPGGPLARMDGKGHDVQGREDFPGGAHPFGHPQSLLIGSIPFQPGEGDTRVTMAGKTPGAEMAYLLIYVSLRS